MTIVNSTHKFIFVHVPKTAGTSVKQHLRFYAGETDIYVFEHKSKEGPASRARASLKKHSTAMEIRHAVGSETFESFFKFCVVRNPFARAISTYRFLKYKFREWPKSGIMDECRSLEDFVVSDFFRSPGPGGIFRPQVRWLENGRGDLSMDYICRLESLETDLSAVRRQLSLADPSAFVGKKNVSGGDLSDISAGLQSGVVVEIIRKRYARDFDLLKYSTEPGEELLRGPE
jgi:hypothetical protein